MDIIEIIIGIGFIAIPVIFKLIGRSLEKSGSEIAGQFKRIAEAVEDEMEEVRKPEEVRPVVMQEETPRQVNPKKTVLLEEEPEKGEKIDPKKLVIYSEIMKPKY